MSLQSFHAKPIRALHDLGRQVLPLCLVIFLVDTVSGIYVASFAVYARSAGMSLVTIGVLNTIVGILKLGVTMPLGMLSDRIGRPGIIMTGSAAFMLGLLTVALSKSTPALVLSLVLNGLAGIAVFQIGHAHLGDLTTPEQRPLAFGLLTTSMGLGFSLGPFIGGLITDRFSYTTAYFFGAATGLVGLLVALLHLRQESPTRKQPAKGGLLSGFKLMLGHANLRLVTYGNLLVGLSFGGTLSTFLPLYGHELLLTQAAIGTMFAVRAGVSAAGRIANSMLAKKVGNLVVMVAGLIVIDLAIFGVGLTTSPVAITVFLGLEGLAYGGFMVAGLTYVSNHTTAENRGGAGGVYSMAAGIGASFAPWILGVVAQQWGIRSVFFVTGSAMAVGVLVFVAGALSLQSAPSTTSAPAPESLQERS